MTTTTATTTSTTNTESGLPNEFFSAMQADEKAAWLAANLILENTSLMDWGILPTVKVTVNQMIAIFASIAGCTFATIEMITKPDMNVRGNANRDAIKRTVVNCAIGISWTNAINRLLAKAGMAQEFVASERTNGTVPLDKKISTDKETGSKFYLSISPRRYFLTEYVNPDGAVVAKEAIEPFLRKSEPIPAKMQRMGLTIEKWVEMGGDADGKDFPRYQTPLFTSIKKVKLGGVVYEIIS